MVRALKLRVAFPLLISCWICFQNPLHSEVDKVVVKWLPGFCSDPCLRDLERRLRSLSDVAEIKFQGSANQVILRWRPDRRFSFSPINQAFRFVGVRINETFLTVRGTISSTRRDVTLESIGDGADFVLLSPIEVNSGETATDKNVQSYGLRPETREELLDVEDNHRVITVEGPLFEPERSGPLYLVIQKMNIPPSWEPPDQHGRRR